MIDREVLVQRFREWLDRLEAAEEAPPGIAPEFLAALGEDQPAEAAGVDQYALWAAMTALTQEVKLQGRSFRQLSEVLAPIETLPPRVDAAVEACSGAAAAAQNAVAREDAWSARREDEIRQEADARARRECIGYLIDIRDRLVRGLELAQSSAPQVRQGLEPAWADRFFRSRAAVLKQVASQVNALIEGYRLSAERLNEVLDELHVEEIDCLGLPYDPRFMRVIDTEETAEADEGTVLGVYRRGYRWGGQLYRAAEVKVARCPTGMTDGAGGDWQEPQHSGEEQIDESE